MPDASSTSYPQIMQAVDTHFDGVKPLFDEVLVGIVGPVAQSDSREGIASTINRKLSLGEIVLLSEFRQKHSI